ncbi:MAG: hypothetical protein DSY37_04465 [Hyperthermus sp.]|nr:MAG: hypothetical protein DSY37_04465 [Hyperthermus sp.]
MEEAFGSGRTAAGVVYFGATRVSSTIVELRGHGSLILGCRRPPCSRLLGALADLLSKGGLSVRLVGSIEPYRWLKLIVNAAINPVTAIACKPNRVILEDDSARNLALALAREAFYVSKLVGVRLPTSNVEGEVVKAARATADNYSSMLQDIIRGRPTEIDYINGAVVHAARRKGASAPVNEAVVLSVKLLESRGSCRMEFPLKDS